MQPWPQHCTFDTDDEKKVINPRLTLHEESGNAVRRLAPVDEARVVSGVSRLQAGDEQGVKSTSRFFTEKSDPGVGSSVDNCRGQGWGANFAAAFVLHDPKGGGEEGI